MNNESGDFISWALQNANRIVLSKKNLS